MSLSTSTAATAAVLAAVVTVASSTVLRAAEGGYDASEAMLALYYSNAVKCPPPNVTDWQCGPSCSRAGPLADVTFVWNDTWDVRGFVGYDDSRDLIVMSFRGTHGILNWIEDFDFKRVNYTSHAGMCGAGCEVHQGFYDTYEYMAQTLLPAVRALATRHASANLFVTGHSLGAAQSQFGMLDLAIEFGATRTVRGYNFGCPRTGNPAFAQWAGALVAANPRVELFRLVHANDPVPMVPWTSMGFEHFPRWFVWFNASLPAPGWVYCNRTGVQAERAAMAYHGGAGSAASSLDFQIRALERLPAGSIVDDSADGAPCGATSFWKFNATDHIYYLGVPMNCELNRHKF